MDALLRSLSGLWKLFLGFTLLGVVGVVLLGAVLQHVGSTPLTLTPEDLQGTYALGETHEQPALSTSALVSPPWDISVLLGPEGLPEGALSCTTSGNVEVTYPGANQHDSVGEIYGVPLYPVAYLTGAPQKGDTFSCTSEKDMVLSLANARSVHDVRGHLVMGSIILLLCFTMALGTFTQTLHRHHKARTRTAPDENSEPAAS